MQGRESLLTGVHVNIPGPKGQSKVQNASINLNVLSPKTESADVKSKNAILNSIYSQADSSTSNTFSVPVWKNAKLPSRRKFVQDPL